MGFCVKTVTDDNPEIEKLVATWGFTVRVALAAAPAAASFDVIVLVVSVIMVVVTTGLPCALKITVQESPAGRVFRVKLKPPAIKLPLPPFVPPGFPAGLRT